MRCKIGVVSIGRMSKSLLREVNFLKLDADFVFSEVLIREGMNLPSELEDADVLISSGYCAQNLRGTTNKPIIVIEPSLYDILSAYSEAVAYDPKPVIIFPLKEYSERITSIQNILSVNILTVAYNNTVELDSMISALRDEGHHCFIGSGLVCDEAERMGLQSVFVYPRESLQSYIRMAYDSAVALREKLRENKFMSLAIDNSKDGILFTDEKGVVLICNQTARALFAENIGNPVGMNVLDHIGNDAIRLLYSESIPVKNVILELRGEQYVLSGYPIYFSRAVANVMLTIYSVASIQSKERHIRWALSDKGFVASHYFSDMSSRNAEFNIMLRNARNFAKHNDNVLILGGTGSGKEVLAQSIHNGSPRAKNPFVAVNCSAIAETLLESELFGYDEGAFTGARKGGKPGFFEMAHGGTIFLDEIGELNMQLQSKLLRAIQEKQVIHVGGSKVISFDVRVIAATNRNLWKMVCENHFREDLYYRLAVLELNLPSLCDRSEDILPLFLSFMEQCAPDLSYALQGSSAQLEELLRAYSWPGNIRELENFVHMASVTVSPANSVQEIIDILGKEIRRRCQRMESVAATQSEAVPRSEPAPQAAAKLRAEQIRKALQEAGGNYSKAAALLGISRTTLWRHLKAADTL